MTRRYDYVFPNQLLFASIRITSIQRSNDSVSLDWESVPGQRYAVEACFELSSPGQWSTLSSNLLAINFVMTLETNLALPARFFRVRVD